MYNTKALRTSLRGQIINAVERAGVSGYEVTHSLNKKGSARFIEFDISDLPSMDERQQSDLEVNVVGPASESDTVEALSDALIEALDCDIVHESGLSFYLYKSTRNYIPDGDPHTARIRMNFDLYIYERN